MPPETPAATSLGADPSRAAAQAPTDPRLGAPLDLVATVTREPGVGQMVEHFRVLRVLGQGGMGRVLLARDTRLGRLVALKVVRPDRLEPERALAIIDEARTMARVSHPHIVAIHHVGHLGEAPYLALEYLDGVTLRQRLGDGPLGEREVVRVGAAVASALAAAHLAGVIHRDLKPENVMMPRDGRPRVVDFGIASRLDSPAGHHHDPRNGEVVGTPGYMAPEQWQGAPPSAAVDVWALGVLLYEALTGQRPFEHQPGDERPLQQRIADPRLPPPPLHLEHEGLATIVGAMLTRDPAQRPSAQQVQEQLERLLHQRNAQQQRPKAGPFRGLLPFEEDDAAWFFGRDVEIDALAEQLRHVSVVPVVGPSAAGKSSLVRAGLLPRLREQGPWTVLTLRPGSRPLEALAARLIANDTTGRHSLTTVAGRTTLRELAAAMADNPRVCNLELHAMAEARGGRVLLVIDQLEEVVTLTTDEGQRRAFLDAIASAADPVDAQVRVVFTLRDDFLGRVAAIEPMREVLRDVFVLRQLDGATLIEAIAQPLARAGGAFDDASLPAVMAAEVEGEPAALPLVQYTCAALWERRDRQTQQLRRADYHALGGVAGALGRHAEAQLSGMTPDDVEAARRLLLQLVGPDGARRLVDRDVAVAAAGGSAEVIVERLMSARLLSSRRVHDSQGARVVLELAHESLRRTWPQLQRWLDESLDDRAAMTEVEAAADHWERRGRRLSELWSGEDARDATRRLRDGASALSPRGRAFLATSAAVAERARRRRVVLWTAAGAVLALITAASMTLAAHLSEQESAQRRLAASLEATNREVEAKSQEVQRAALEMTVAAADMGVIGIDLAFFDWDPEALVARPAAPVALSAIDIFDVDPDVLSRAGRRRDPRWVRVERLPPGGPNLRFDLETRAGPAVLRLARAGCGPVDVPLRRVPGYAERREREARGGPVERWTLPVPTCAASLAGTIAIPAGPYIEGGVGEPPLASPLRSRPEAIVELPAYHIDRTEVANAHYQVFAAAKALTGVPEPDYPTHTHLPHVAEARHPVTGVDVHAAEAFCRWMGRRLPTSDEWTKAGRGGLSLADGAPNPRPRRNLPWGGLDASPRGLEGRVNTEDVEGRWGAASVPADALPAGASPYGVLGFGGNVAEWTATAADGHGAAQLRIVRDGSWDQPSSHNLGSLGLVNERSARYIYFALGWRCAVDGR